MNTDYSKYKTEDFLTDDKFVYSMLNPTEENMAFWKSITDEHVVDINEFISAYMTLKSLHDVSPEVPEGRPDEIWKRIQHSNQAKIKHKKRISMFRYSTIAASIVFILGLSVFSYLQNKNENGSQSLVDFANASTTHTKHESKYIQLISNDEALTLVGTQANVEYDVNGRLKVNKETIESSDTEIPTTSFNQLRVPYGKRAFLVLSDGTELWVNVGTVVSYPTKFSKDIREIYVDGEVFANVTHDANRPFVIRTNKLDVRVLGTSFNLAAYKNDNQTNVVLVNGSVHVQPKVGKETVIKPNQMYVYTDQSTTLETVDVENYTSWRNGNYTFRNESIENVLLRLSHYYNVAVKLPVSTSGKSFSGKLELKDDMKQMMDGLTKITNMNYLVKDSMYIIEFN